MRLVVLATACIMTRQNQLRRRVCIKKARKDIMNARNLHKPAFVTKDGCMKWNMKIVHAGVYRQAQKGSQTTDYFFVNFVYSGLKYLKTPNGQTLTQVPALSLRAPGVLSEFEFGPNRENWVIIIQTSDVRQSVKPNCVDLRCDDQWVEVPWFLLVEPSQAAWWQNYFMQIYDLMQSPTRVNVLLAEMRVVHVLEQFLAPTAAVASTPAQHLKTLIDHDLAANRTLKTLATQCGYSADHLRVLFEQQYGLSHIAYRQRRRMSCAMEHITRSGRSIKQIALVLGFNQVAHFSAAFRQAYDMTPGQAITRFRQY